MMLFDERYQSILGHYESAWSSHYLTMAPPESGAIWAFEAGYRYLAVEVIRK
tara:strand:- start:41 stop:196 length:156 start_codon:yes stop_codon:yes gene_type:complete